jgi:hypothetical protein
MMSPRLKNVPRAWEKIFTDKPTVGEEAPKGQEKGEAPDSPSLSGTGRQGLPHKPIREKGHREDPSGMTSKSVRRFLALHCSVSSEHTGWSEPAPTTSNFDESKFLDTR